MDAFRRRKQQDEQNDDTFRRSGLKPLNKSITTTSSTTKKSSILEDIPSEYQYNYNSVTPQLYYLPKALEENSDTNNMVNLRSLLKAATADIRLHRGRQQAGKHRNPKLIKSYQIEQDESYLEIKKNLQERLEKQDELVEQETTILDELSNDIKGLTQLEKQSLMLARWQRALELYVLLPQTSNKLDWQHLFAQLLDSISEDQDISQVLKSASTMCEDLVNSTRRYVEMSKLVVSTEETAYCVKLEAHQMYSKQCLKQTETIEQQFQTSGKAALQIGHQLEHAELKRSQCEAASILIRRWWILESLAEQEVNSKQKIAVTEEIDGIIPANAARLDHLFTKPENSLEASRALKQLRAVVRSRSASKTSDENAQRKFLNTANLIARVSDALEQRLLNTFSRVYTSGGTYDFSLKKGRSGIIDWRELRSLAAALLLFDSGRNLHKRYVDMVVSSRFPEFFEKEPEREEDDHNNMMADYELDTFENKRGFNMDETRTKLSNLFHKVGDVCTVEFELIAHVFGSEGGNNRTDVLDGGGGSEEMPLVVARALLQRVVSDPVNGLQARINDLLRSIDKRGDFDAGAKKLDTFVIIHEKASGLFQLLKDAADRMAPENASSQKKAQSVESLKGFLTSQELALSNTHRQSYVNLELRLLHHDCCASLDHAGCTLVKGPSPRPDMSLAEKGILEEYRAPILPLHKASLLQGDLRGIMSGPLKQSVLRQPLIHATDSLARARVMFGTAKRGGEATSRVILTIYNQMCCFYGEGFLYPIVEVLRELLPTSPPSAPPPLPFDEEMEAPDLGVPPAFWLALERVLSASKSFDRELWAEGRENSQRVWETLDECGDAASISFAKGERIHFYAELERRGEAAILQALDTLSMHVQWVFVTGGESMLATGGKRIMGTLTGSSAGGPYAIPAGSPLDTPNSPAVKALAFCLRHQFVRVQAALTPESLSNFWTALSMRLYDILVARLLQHYFISTVGAVILSRDVEALRSVAMLAGGDHSHWDTLRDILTLYMSPPDAIKVLLTGPEGEASRGLFAKAGRDKCLVFLSRRNDYRYKTASGIKKSGWVAEMLEDLNISDPTDGSINIGLFAAGRKN